MRQRLNVNFGFVRVQLGIVRANSSLLDKQEGTQDWGAVTGTPFKVIFFSI